MIDTVAAEWLKLRTARSTRLVLGTLAVFTALILGIAWYFVATWDGLSPEARAHASLGSLPDLLGWITSLVMAVFGTLAITSEFGSGMIRTTFVAMPRRPEVLAAKALVVAAVTFVATAAALLVALVGGAVIIGDRPIGGQPRLDSSGAILVLAYGLSTAAFALIGLALGALTRSGLAATVALALLWYLVPLIVGHVPPPWNLWLSSLVPGALAGELAGTGNVNSVFGAALSPAAALLVMVAYALGPLAAGMMFVVRRDA
jgi:ABC-type transport system involved in multi-copper enzyme maturation permease subunit